MNRFELLADWVDGRLDPVRVREARALTEQDGEAAELLAWIRRTAEALRCGPPELTEESRDRLLAAFHARSAVDEALAFTCLEDSLAAPAPAGVRRASTGERLLKFRGPAFDVEISWRPAPEGEPGVLAGRVVLHDAEPADGLRIEVSSGSEAPRFDTTSDGGRFVVPDVAQAWPLRVFVEDPEPCRGRFRVIEIPRTPLG